MRREISELQDKVNMSEESAYSTSSRVDSAKPLKDPRIGYYLPSEGERSSDNTGLRKRGVSALVGAGESIVFSKEDSPNRAKEKQIIARKLQ
ncbi:unnamed protein product [Sphagnum balticum]